MIHPGRIVALERELKGWKTQRTLARHLDVGRYVVEELEAGARDIDRELACRLSSVLPPTHLFWLDLQAGYDTERNCR